MKKIFQAILLSSVMVFAACTEDETNVEWGAEVRTFNLDGTKFNMIKVDGGTFLMGAQKTDPEAPNYDPNAKDLEAPVHSVTVSTFYIAEFETTCNIVRKAGISAGMGSESNMPIRNIYRSDILMFIENLNEIMHENGQLAKNEKFTLPTEAQWEYAARGGKKSHGYIYAGSNDYSKVVCCKQNSGQISFEPVGSFAPNELGLYDMSGNCCELCIDVWGNYSEESQVDPQGPAIVTDNQKWVVRGGSFYAENVSCRVSNRSYIDDFTNNNSTTVRLALVTVR